MENIKVALRLRPYTKEEKIKNEIDSWKLDKEVQMIKSLNPEMPDLTFTLDQVYDDKSTNNEIYSTLCKDVIIKALEGIDTTIFVYGQTGAGKTHTMLGPPKDSSKFNGIIFQSLEDIYNKIELKDKSEDFVISCSYIEIYNDLIFDLLNKPEDLQNPLVIQEKKDNQKFVIKGKTQVKIKNISEVYKILNYGETNRKYAETYFNHMSSRSHTIFQISIRVTKICDKGENFIKESTINFVDLAGNERLLYEYKLRSKGENKSKRRSGSENKNLVKNFNSNGIQEFYTPIEKTDRLKESKYINKSLFFLTQVIYLSSRGKNIRHIPFRNSPLTKILRSSLGGNSRTVLILCVAPCLRDFEISLSTLRFGKCAKKIENKVKMNVVSSFNKEAIQKIVDDYEKKIEMYHSKIMELENKQIDFTNFWKNFSVLKQKIISNLLDFDQKKKTQEKKKLFDIATNFREDIIFSDVGLLFGIIKENEETLKHCFDSLNCKNCYIKQIHDKFNIKTIPLIFNKFKEKLEKESEIEENIINFQKTIKNHDKELIEENQYLIASLESSMNKIYPFFEKLIKKNNNDFEEIINDKIEAKGGLTDSEIQTHFAKIEECYKAYQEEIIRRKVMKEYNIQTDCSYLSTENVEKSDYIQVKQFEALKKEFELNLQNIKNNHEVKKNKILNNFNSKLETLNTELTIKLDNVYEINYSIQERLFQIHKDFKKRINFFKNKFKFLYNKEHKNPNIKNEDEVFPRLKMIHSLSDGNISAKSEILMNKNTETLKENDNFKELFVYNKFDSNMNKIKEINRDMKDLKDLHLRSLSMNSFNNNKVLIKNIEVKEFEASKEKEQEQKNVIKEKKSEKPLKKRFHKIPMEKKEVKKFDIEDYIKGDLDTSIDLNKFKIVEESKKNEIKSINDNMRLSLNDTETLSNKESDRLTFNQTITPITMEKSLTSFQTKNTIFEIHNEFLLPENKLKKSKSKKKIEDNLTFKKNGYLQSRTKTLKDLILMDYSEKVKGKNQENNKKN